MKKSQESPNLFDEEWIVDLMDKCEDVILGYEDYLLDRMNSRQLAIIIKQLRKTVEKKMPIVTVSDSSKKKK